MIRPLFTFIVCVAIVANLSPLCHGAKGAGPEPAVIDGIAAVVNGEVITYGQVKMLVGPREKLLRSQYTGEELAKRIKEVRQAALKDLIDRELIVQNFRKEQFQIPDYFVEQQITQIIRENFGGDRNTFIKTLQAQDATLGEFKKLEMEKIIVQAMRSKNVKPAAAISPGKIQEFYDKNRDKFTAKEQVKLRLIMIPSNAADGNAAAQKGMAEEIISKIAGGAEFERMAQMYSEDGTRDVGGDWGWVERKTLAEPLEKAAFNLPKGKVSNIIELGGNFYILKCEDRRGGATRSFAEVRTEIEKKLMQDEARRQQELWLASLREKAYIRTF